jgi:hypothetical protein
MLGRHLVDHPFLSNVMSLCFLTHIRFSFMAPGQGSIRVLLASKPVPRPWRFD